MSGAEILAEIARNEGAHGEITGVAVLVLRGDGSTLRTWGDVETAALHAYQEHDLNTRIRKEAKPQ